MDKVESMFNKVMTSMKESVGLLGRIPGVPQMKGGAGDDGMTQNILIILAVVAILAGALYYIYKRNLIPQLNNMIRQLQGQSSASIDAGEGGANGVAELFLFKVDWCPHCKKATPIFEELRNELNGRPINGYTVAFKVVDCEQDPELADQFKVEGYPTIKLVKNGQVIEYDAKPDKETLKQFLESSL